MAYLATTITEKHNWHYNPHIFECNRNCAAGANSKHLNPNTFTLSCKDNLDCSQRCAAVTSPDYSSNMWTNSTGSFFQVFIITRSTSFIGYSNYQDSPTVNPHTKPALSTTQAQLFSNSTIMDSTEVAIPPQPTPLHSDQEPQHDFQKALLPVPCWIVCRPTHNFTLVTDFPFRRT